MKGWGDPSIDPGDSSIEIMLLKTTEEKSWSFWDEGDVYMTFGKADSNGIADKVPTSNYFSC